MLKNISSFGTVLSKTEQQSINGGDWIYLFGEDCYIFLCGGNDFPEPPINSQYICAHPFSCSDNIFEP